jgi:hypothetical protein
MYTREQKESSSTSSTSIHRKSNGSDGERSFSVQRQPEINSSQEKERPSYSRKAADLLAANVMRSMPAREQGEEAQGHKGQEGQGAASVAQVVMPKPQLPIAPVASVFRPSGEMAIGRQCSACQQAMEFGKDSDEMLSVAGIQTKLTVGAPGDRYEQEADRMAAQVMRMSVAPDNSPQVQRFGEEDNPVQRWSLAQSITPVVHRRVDEQVQMRELVQRAFQTGGNEASGDLDSRLNASKGGASALAPEVRAFMEPRFGADFSSVRVHTGSEAVQMNRELGAQAFAHGSDVYFGAGKSPGNNELTAHELTHVVQQTSSTNSPIQRQCGVDESCVEEPNASYPEPNYTPATPEANASYPNKVLHGEARYTPADANMSTPDGTEVYVDAPPQQTDTDTTTDVESQADTGAGGSPGLEQEAHEGGAEGGPNAHSTSQEPSQEPSDEESWWDRGIDWVENKVASGAHQLADKADGIPVLEQVADAGAWMVDQQTQLTGGILKGAGTMVGGIANMIVHPVDTVMGLEAMAEHAPMLPGVPNPLKVAHGLYDIAVNGKDVGEVANHVLNPIQSLQDDFEFGKKMVGGITKPYQQAIKQGKYSEALGRGIFDIGSLFIGGGAGAKGAASAGRGAAIAGEVADAARIANVASDAAKVAEGAGVASDAAKVAKGTAVGSDAAKVAEAADAAKIANQSKGSILAKTKGYPDPEPGYHWAEVNGKLVYKRNPLRGEGLQRPERVYDPETQSFKDVESPVAEPVEGEPLTTAQKGKFGEQKADAFMEENGFVKRGSHDAPGPGGGKPKPQGIDGVYENTNPPPKWVVGEAKYDTAGYGQTQSGKQMSQPWTDARLDHAVGKKLADQIRLDGYERWELRVDPSGKVTPTKITW